MGRILKRLKVEFKVLVKYCNILNNFFYVKLYCRHSHNHSKNFRWCFYSEFFSGKGYKTCIKFCQSGVAAKETLLANYFGQECKNVCSNKQECFRGLCIVFLSNFFTLSKVLLHCISVHFNYLQWGIRYCPAEK